MAVEIKDTVFGRLVPEHLFNFTGNTQVSSFYRDLLKNKYARGFEKMDLGECATCHSSQTVNDRPRLKSLPNMTRRIRRLLMKQTSGKMLSKYGQHLLKKYLQTKQTMVVQCPKCQSLNRMSLMSKEDLILLRGQRLMAVERLKLSDQEPISIKKKRKKKKHKTKETFAPNSLLSVPTEVSCSLSTTTSSSLKHSLTSNSSTGSSESKQSVSLQVLINSNRVENKSSSSLLQKSLENRATTLRKPVTTPRTGESTKKKSASKQKQLKEFLKESFSSDKSASLSDFLSSL